MDSLFLKMVHYDAPITVATTSSMPKE